MLLAAGLSSRFGGSEPKQLFEIAGRSLVRRAAETALASSLGELVVVLGHAATRVRAELEDLDLTCVLNPDFARGQSTSVKCGLARVDPTAAAALFLTCDQPWLSSATLELLLEAYATGRGKIIVPSFQGRRGSPVLFDRGYFPVLETLEGDQGGRALFGYHPTAITTVELESDRPLLDIDTLEQMRRAFDKTT